jgi:hypothetical protein
MQNACRFFYRPPTANRPIAEPTLFTGIVFNTRELLCWALMGEWGGCHPNHQSFVDSEFCSTFGMVINIYI